MPIRKFVLDDVFENDKYTLIAIHCNLEDYRIVYMLNKFLNSKLTRSKDDVLDSKKGTYSLFYWNDPNDKIDWHLVCNKDKKVLEVENTPSNMLFSDQQNNVVVNYLIPELSKVNYFLKITNELSLIRQKQLIQNILNIPYVITAYTQDLDKIKSKHNLIFN